MDQANRKGYPLCDNCTAHGNNNSIFVLGLKSIEVVFLRPNTASILQPLDADVIIAVAFRYCRKYIDRGLGLDDIGIINIYKVDQLQAMQWFGDSLEKLKPGTVPNCWRHTKHIGERSADMISSQHITLNYEEEALE